MRALIFILLLLTFFQATFLPINLALLILVSRAYIRVDKSNFYLAFAFGLLASLLKQTPLGIDSLIYLTLVQLAHLAHKLPFAKNILTVIPLSFITLFANDLLTSLINKQSLAIFPEILIGTLLALPIYIAVRVWEERFIIKSDIKLKI